MFCSVAYSILSVVSSVKLESSVYRLSMPIYLLREFSFVFIEWGSSHLASLIFFYIFHSFVYLLRKKISIPKFKHGYNFP